MEFIVEQGLKPIPEKSKFYQAINDVIKWHKQYPDDWKRCWFEFEKKNTSEKGCPEGVFNAFNIDASVNAAYVVIGLSYGEKDFFKTMDIATRCGQDSDCNPATAAGILGVVIGYNKIPAFWKPAIEKVEDLKFPYSDLTLNQIYDLSYKHATTLIAQNGGEVNDSSITIKVQTPEILPLQQSFEGMYPTKELLVRKDFLGESIKIDFTGNGIVVLGNVKSQCGQENRLYPVIYFTGNFTSAERALTASSVNQKTENNEICPILLLFLNPATISQINETLPVLEEKLRIRKGYRFRAIAGYRDEALNACRVAVNQAQFSYCILLDAQLQKDQFSDLLSGCSPMPSNILHFLLMLLTRGIITKETEICTCCFATKR